MVISHPTDNRFLVDSLV